MTILGAYPNGYKCVEALLNRKFKNAEANKLICYLYQMRDNLENSAFMYAALNCPVETIGKYLIKIPEPKFWYYNQAFVFVTFYYNLQCNLFNNQDD